MAQRYGVLAERLQPAFSRGILKVRIDEAERKIANHEQSKCLFRDVHRFLAGVMDAPVSTSGRCYSRFANVFEPRSTLFVTSISSLIPRSELKSNFARSPPRFLVPSKGLVLGDRAALFCSEARVCTSTEAGQGQGMRDGSTAKNLTRWARKAGQEKSQSMVMYLTAVVVAVVGFTYASVPLYRRFCQATGYGGTVQRRETVEEKIAKHGSEAATRELVVTFNADVADAMPWKFKPCQNQVKVRVGESSLAFYTAENTSNEDITGVSTYNVAPMQAGQYFTKIQCFCFEEQRLCAGEKIDMPVLFYIDPEFATDPKMDSVNSLILSYTFFKVDEEEDE